MDLTNAIVYDEETFPNAFTLAMEFFNDDRKAVWELSQFRDDRRELFAFIDWARYNNIPMISFNGIAFDYPVLHYILKNPNCTPKEIYDKAQAVIHSGNMNRWDHQIWQSDRVAPQIDLFKINHFDNKAKTTSLKALQINMRSETVVECPIPFGTVLTQDQINRVVIPYNQHDVKETKRFGHNCISAINFRIGLIEQIKGDVINFSDAKIGEKILEQRIGDEICYEPAYYDNDPFTGERTYNRKRMRQTVRSRIALNDIIFPYIRFDNPEFNRVLTWMKGQVLTPDDLDDPDAVVKTKGTFVGVHATVGGIDFKFGTGGLHASVLPQRIFSDDQYVLQDVDVAGYYPATAIVNRLAPAHLGEAYVREYTRLPIERKEWQKKKGKKCVEANSLKLAGNGVYGKSNSPFSVFYDPQYTMTVTINCQLLLCMLAEWLLAVPSVQIIQANTDGITYRIHRSMVPLAKQVWKRWEDFTLLTLEDTEYRRMWIRDVNNYIAEPYKGDLKQKGAYWHPDPMNYADSISESQPPAWHKDLGNTVSIRAAVAAMVHGVNPEHYIRAHTDKFDFMLRAKVGGVSKLMLGDRQIQKTSRYYIAIKGEPLRKISPPTGTPGTYKRKPKLTDHEYESILATLPPGTHDERIHTKNKSVYKDNVTAFDAGFLAAECNDASTFDFNNINHAYYVNEARKLII